MRAEGLDQQTGKYTAKKNKHFLALLSCFPVQTGPKINTRQAPTTSKNQRWRVYKMV